MITGITLKLQENSQNIEKNTTNVTISATISWGGGSYDAIGKPLTLLLDGVEADKVSATFNTNQSYGGSEVFYTYTGDVAHDYAGEKTLACTLIYATTLLGGTRRAEESFCLTPIPRASLIAATDAAVGAVSAVTVTRRSAAYRHAIAYAFGSLSGWLDAEGAITGQQTLFTATAIPFAIPQSFYSEITDAPSGRCTLTCTTYSGDTQIGEPQSTAFTVYAAASGPVVTGRIEDCRDATLALTGDPSTLVRYASHARCTLTATPQNGATITQLTIGGEEVTDGERIIEHIDRDTVAFSATDSRGFTAVTAVTAPMVFYIPLTLSAAVKRTDPTGGEALLTVRGNCYSGSFGARDNTLKLTYAVGEQEGVLEASFDGDSYTASAILSGLDYRTAHTVTLTAADALQTLTHSLTVPKGIPVFDWGENDFAFHVPVALEQGFTVKGKPLLDLLHPVDSLYMASVDTDPATLFGGSWTAVENELGLYLWKRIF